MVRNHLEGKNAGASWAIGLCSPRCKDINAIPVEDIHGFQVSGIQLSLSLQLLKWEEVWFGNAAQRPQICPTKHSVLSPPLVFVISLIGRVPFLESNKDKTSIQVSGVKKMYLLSKKS